MKLSASDKTINQYTNQMLLALLIVLALFSSMPSNSQGFTPTPAQIEQFKKMSPAQQQQLARSMGIDIDDYSDLISGKGVDSFTSLDEISGVRALPEDPALSEMLADNFGQNLTKNDMDTLATENQEDLVSALEPFGYDMFSLGAESFQPNTDISAPQDYLMGTGDTIIVQLYGKQNQQFTAEVNREGNIFFPDIGPITIAGLTFSQTRDRIDTITEEQMIGIKASTTMGRLRNIRIFVLGEARIPGSYVVGSLSTMTNAIFASGGITKIGSLRNVQLKRNGKVITTLDLYDLLLNGDTSKDVRVKPGDVIFIPPTGKTIGVAGAVKRPAIYELKNEKSTAQALALAGGLLPTAYAQSSRIERVTRSGEKTLINVDLSTNSGKTLRIKDADNLIVHSALDNMQGVVNLKGHVKRPRGFAWKPGLRFSDVLSNVNEMLPNPDLQIGLITREDKTTRKLSAHIFSPIKAIQAPGSIKDIELHMEDEIEVFGYVENRSELVTDLVATLRNQANFSEREQIVVVYGAVRYPGEYPRTKNMTSRDLVALAGGLTESALGNDGEITRFSLTDERKTAVSHISINLDTETQKLQAADTLRVKQIPLWSKKESVQILGEVLHPGVYPIIPGETLLDVIARAGGLTDYAYSRAAIFSRERLRNLEEERLESLRAEVESDIVATNLTDSIVSKRKEESEIQLILDNIDSVKPLGRMVIDLPRLLREPREFNFSLESGDILTIPRYNPSVTVVGEVQHATSHFFNKRFSTRDYIEQSGGMRKSADKARVYIVKASGRVILPRKSSWFKSADLNIEPGDTIIVPVETDKVDKITLWSSISSILSSTAIGVAALSNLN